MNTLGNTTKAGKITRLNSHCITLSFLAAVALVEGETVKLNTDGTISPVTAVTDLPLGTVTVGNKGDVTNRVTVLTNFKAVARGFADGVVAVGARVAALGSSTINGEKLTDYKTAVTTNYVIGQAIKGGADNTVVEIGLYYQPALI